MEVEKMLKRIARRILHTEIETYEKAIRDMRSDKTAFEDYKNGEIVSCKEETKKALEEKCKIERENEILRKYYDLDKEPSDEIKTKIHIDLEINRLKEEKLQLIAMFKQQVQYIPQPYPVYPPFGRF